MNTIETYIKKQGIPPHLLPKPPAKTALDIETIRECTNRILIRKVSNERIGSKEDTQGSQCQD